MRRLLGYALAVSLALLAYGADSGATHKTTRKATARKTVAHKSVPKATASRGKKGATKTKTRATTWRNRQLAPTPERYKEIQDALVAKGYLRPEEAGSGWNQTSMDALKRFQSEQNIESTGKINSLSLIALGLGPKHDTAASKAETPGSQQDPH